jgi:hypothetical protein
LIIIFISHATSFCEIRTIGRRLGKPIEKILRVSYTGRDPILKSWRKRQDQNKRNKSYWLERLR